MLPQLIGGGVGAVQGGMQGGGGSSKSGGVGDMVKNAAISFGTKALLGALCDMRFKTDVSPLETTGVNNDLAEIAFFVKGLRECA